MECEGTGEARRGEQAESRSLEPPLEVTRSNLKRFSIAPTAGPARINRMDVTEKRVGNLEDPRFLGKNQRSGEAKARASSKFSRSYKNRAPFSERSGRTNLICWPRIFISRPAPDN